MFNTIDYINPTPYWHYHRQKEINHSNVAQNQFKHSITSRSQIINSQFAN